MTPLSLGVPAVVSERSVWRVWMGSVGALFLSQSAHSHVTRCWSKTCVQGSQAPSFSVSVCSPVGIRDIHVLCVVMPDLCFSQGVHNYIIYSGELEKAIAPAKLKVISRLLSSPCLPLSIF